VWVRARPIERVTSVGVKGGWRAGDGYGNLKWDSQVRGPRFGSFGNTLL
jgi:hypothetical protein